MHGAAASEKEVVESRPFVVAYHTAHSLHSLHMFYRKSFVEWDERLGSREAKACGPHV